MKRFMLIIALLTAMMSACTQFGATNAPAETPLPPTATEAAVATATPTSAQTESAIAGSAIATETVTTETVTTETVTTATTVPPTPSPAATAVITSPDVAPDAVAEALPQGTGYENLTSAVDLLASYYDAINRQEYERAYSYWQGPPLDYPSFAAGYGDTAGVQLIVQPPTRIEGAAGSLYAEIPSVLIAQHHDGTVHSFAGCIVTRKSNLQPPDIPQEDVWHIYQARLEEVANNASLPTLLAEGCAS